MCLVSYSAPMAMFGMFGRSRTTPPSCSITILSAIPVLRNFTIDRSSFVASPARADGARFFLAGVRDREIDYTMIEISFKKKFYLFIYAT